MLKGTFLRFFPSKYTSTVAYICVGYSKTDTVNSHVHETITGVVSSRGFNRASWFFFLRWRTKLELHTWCMWIMGMETRTIVMPKGMLKPNTPCLRFRFLFCQDEPKPKWSNIEWKVKNVIDFVASEYFVPRYPPRLPPQDWGFNKFIRIVVKPFLLGGASLAGVAIRVIVWLPPWRSTKASSDHSNSPSCKEVYSIARWFLTIQYIVYSIFQTYLAIPVPNLLHLAVAQLPDPPATTTAFDIDPFWTLESSNHSCFSLTQYLNNSQVSQKNIPPQ